MSKSGLLGNGSRPQPAFADNSTMMGRVPGGVLPERGSRDQYDIVQQLLQSSMGLAPISGSPLIAALTPMIGGAIGTRTKGLYRDGQEQRDNAAIEQLLSTMAPAHPAVLPGSRNPNYGAMAAASMPGNERDLLALTLAAEAGGEGLDGMLAAGAVIANRVNAGGYGDGLSGVIMKPGQFSAWNSLTGYAGGEGGLDMDSIRPSAEAYQAADMILSGNYQDPTGGATHYYNPSAANPDWGQRAGGQWQRIGNHVFGRADGEGRTPARDAAGRLASGDFSTLSGLGVQPMNQDSMRTLITLMNNTEVSDPIRDIAWTMMGEAMDNRSGLSPREQIGLARDMLGLEAAMAPLRSHGRFRTATPEEAAANGATAGQIGPDGRFYPSGPNTASGNAGLQRQQNEATTIIERALAELTNPFTGLNREEGMALLASDPVYARQFEILGIDRDELVRVQEERRAREEAEIAYERDQKLLNDWHPFNNPKNSAPNPAPLLHTDKDPLGIR